MDGSLHAIELQILQAIGIIVGGVMIYALQRIASWFGLKLQADQTAMLNSAVDKAMTFGVTQADDVIRAKGWDHSDSKNQVLNFAVNAIEDKFAGTLKANNIDLTNPGDRAQLLGMMERMWPDVASRLSASPVTPPLTPPDLPAIPEPAKPAG